MTIYYGIDINKKIDSNARYMDNNKKTSKKTLQNITPQVILANYINVPHAGWPKHTVKTPELVLIIHGTFTAKYQHYKKITLIPGNVLLIPTNTPCDLLHTENTQAVISCIHFELYQNKSHINGDYQLEIPPPWAINTNEDWRLIDLFRNCASEFTGHNIYRELLLRSMFKEIWIRLIRHSSEKETTSSQRTRRMKAYIRQNLKGDINRLDLAKQFSLTPEYINAIFKKEIGISPTGFINRERVLYAATLITSGRYSISEAAYEAGFTDPLYFSRVFKKEIGIPPSQLK